MTPWLYFSASNDPLTRASNDPLTLLECYPLQDFLQGSTDLHDSVSLQDPCLVSRGTSEHLVYKHGHLPGEGESESIRLLLYNHSPLLPHPPYSGWCVCGVCVGSGGVCGMWWWCVCGVCMWVVVGCVGCICGWWWGVWGVVVVCVVCGGDVCGVCVWGQWWSVCVGGMYVQREV